MINVEAQIFTKLNTALSSSFPGIFVTSEDTRIPSVFPCVSCIEMDNYTNMEYQTSSHTEDFANLTYQITIWTNNDSGKKSKAKEILAAIDTIMFGLNFHRLSVAPINEADATAYRIVARYTGVVSKNNTLYRS